MYFLQNLAISVAFYGKICYYLVIQKQSLSELSVSASFCRTLAFGDYQMARNVKKVPFDCKNFFPRINMGRKDKILIKKKLWKPQICQKESFCANLSNKFATWTFLLNGVSIHSVSKFIEGKNDYGDKFSQQQKKTNFEYHQTNRKNI